MASPDAFLSSPAHPRRRAAQAAASSSPELPSIQDILSQMPPRPPLKIGGNAAPVPESSTSTATSAGGLRRMLQADQSANPSFRPSHVDPPVVEDIETSDSIIEIRPSDFLTKRKPHQEYRAQERTEASSESSSCPNLRAANQPWRKYKLLKEDPSNPSAEPAPDARDETKQAPVSDKDKDAENAHSCYFRSPEAPKPTRVRARKDADNEPLNLEAAMVRRTDWTPPARAMPIIIDSEEPSRLNTSDNAQGDEPPETFENILASYKCNRALPLETGSTSASDDSNFLRKRKLLELVPKQLVHVLEPENMNQSPTRRKAPKKKTRTITGIATAAYRPQPQPEQATVPESEHGAAKPGEAGGKKSKPRKRATKTSKKKEPLPKPILLTPGAALRQVARQEFVFGISSQLAREQSPTLLRDLEAVMKVYNELDSAKLKTPINSDELEPPEKRPTLWDAGARDADGDLLDFEVRNFADASGLPEPVVDADPFGYVRCEKEDVTSLPELPAGGGPLDDSLVVLSDNLPLPEGCKPLEVVGIDCSLSGSEVPANPQHTDQAAENPPAPVQVGKADRILAENALGGPPNTGMHGPEPAYELYSDAQLAKQLAQYGFKPIKKRTAMIALLTRCRQDRARAGPAVIRSTFAADSGASRQASTSTAVTREKRPRGRPRKVTVSEEEAKMQPPPSAQPSESPRRRRGRPRKDAGSPSSSTSPTSAGRPTKVESRAPAKPKGAKAAKTVIKIPDSQSDAAEDSVESPYSSADSTFSQAERSDLSLAIDEDTELSLSTSPSDQQTSLFRHITKAVTSAPRTTDPADPSWHEKILMYDAIVLEDLTSWLNSGQLMRVGCDDEVSVGEVKQWCESKSVCCLWKVSLRGKERKRY